MKTKSNNEIKCVNCGAVLNYEPGTDILKCPYCGTENKIPVENIDVGELLAKVPYEAFVRNSNEKILEIQNTVVCHVCGAQITIESHVISADCPFCGTPLIIENSIEQKIVKPHIIIPFNISRKQSIDKFKQWIKSKWFAPDKLKKYVKVSEKMQGVYVPYWVYDAYTITYYTGERGDEYTDSEGNKKIRWTPVSGTFTKQFKNLPVSASHTLSKGGYRVMYGWDFTKAQPFNTHYLAGFRAENYQISVKEGFQKAKFTMEFRIENDIKRHIGGDRQRINSMDVNYENVGFLLALLPLWISAYRYKNKTYRFVVNGQTGAVSAKYPLDWVKIILLILIAVVLIGLLFYFKVI